MATESERDYTQLGQESYQHWGDELHADPEYQAVYEEEAAKSYLWLQLVEARRAAGPTQRDLAKRLCVSQAQVARLEKRGYDAYTLSSLRHYVQALGEGFCREVPVRSPAREPETSPSKSRRGRGQRKV